MTRTLMVRTDASPVQFVGWQVEVGTRGCVIVLLTVTVISKAGKAVEAGAVGDAGGELGASATESGRGMAALSSNRAQLTDSQWNIRLQNTVEISTADTLQIKTEKREC